MPALRFANSADDTQDSDGSTAKERIRYENPGHHDPLSSNFNRRKSVLPSNHRELFDHSVFGSDGNRWTVEGKEKKRTYHRFQDDGNDNWHWNGSSNSKLKDGTPNSIADQNVPIDIKRLNNE